MNLLEPNFDRLTELTNDLRDESDRGAAVLAVAMLEEKLREAISRRLGEFSKDILDRLAPSGGMGWTIISAAMLGLITRDERNDLHTICKVRNRFAHAARQGLRFDNPEISQDLAGLGTADQIPIFGEGPTIRQRYLLTVSRLYVLVEMRSHVLPRFPLHSEEEWPVIGRDGYRSQS